MNAIELYKKLPKKNCGQCRQKKCMPFALSLIKGEAALIIFLVEGFVYNIEAALSRPA